MQICLGSWPRWVTVYNHLVDRCLFVQLHDDVIDRLSAGLNQCARPSTVGCAQACTFPRKDQELEGGHGEIDRSDGNLEMRRAISIPPVQTKASGPPNRVTGRYAPSFPAPVMLLCFHRGWSLCDL